MNSITIYKNKKIIQSLKEELNANNFILTDFYDEELLSFYKNFSETHFHKMTNYQKVLFFDRILKRFSHISINYNLFSIFKNVIKDTSIYIDTIYIIINENDIKSNDIDCILKDFNFEIVKIISYNKYKKLYRVLQEYVR